MVLVAVDVVIMVLVCIEEPVDVVCPVTMVQLVIVVFEVVVKVLVVLLVVADEVISTPV